MSWDKERGADVEVLSTRAGPKGGSVLAQVEAYWLSLRGARLLPLRSDVDPARIDSALPHAFILERVAPGVARMRVAGQALSGYLGADARGMPISAFFTATARPRLREQLDRAFDLPAIVDLPLVSARGPLRQPLSGRLLILPLLGRDDGANRALGALLLDGPAARGPRQFDIPEDGAMRCEELTAPRVVPRRVVAVSGGDADVPRLAPSERPWLRLVVSNG